MRIRTSVRLVVLMLACVALAASAPSAQYVAASYEALTVADTAVGITASMLTVNGQQVRVCRGRLETAQVRWRYDGTAPTAGEGILLEIGDWLVLDRYENITRFRAIRTGAVSGVLRMTCEVAK